MSQLQRSVKPSAGTVLRKLNEDISLGKNASEVEKILANKGFAEAALFGESSDPNKVVRGILFQSLRARRMDILKILFEGNISPEVKARFRVYLTQKHEGGDGIIHAILLGFGGSNSKVPRNDNKISEVVEYICKIFQGELAKVFSASRAATPSIYPSQRSAISPPPPPATSSRSSLTPGPLIRRSTFERHLSSSSASNITTPGPSTRISDARTPRGNYLLNAKQCISFEGRNQEPLTPLDLAYELKLPNTAETLIKHGAKTSAQLEVSNMYTQVQIC